MNAIQKALSAYLKDYADTLSRLGQATGHHRASLQALAVEHGRIMDSAPFTDEIRKDLREILRQWDFQIKRCFANAQLIVQWHDGFEYFEGFFLNRKVPIALHHAWTVYRGVIVDVTCRPFGEKAGSRSVKTLVRHIERNVQESAYWGVPIDRKRVRVRANSGTYGTDFLGEMLHGRNRAARAIST